MSCHVLPSVVPTNLVEKNPAEDKINPSLNNNNKITNK